jgi:hypothetical protein
MVDFMRRASGISYRALMAAEDGGSGGGNSPPPPPPPAVGEDETKKTFPYEYVKELREENGRYRRQKTDAERERDNHKAELEKVKTEADAKVAKAAEEAKTAGETTQKAANERVIRAEMKAFAIKAGIVDLDILKLADLASIKLNDKGEVEGAEELIAKLKETKPYAFGDGKASTSGTAPVPPRQPGTAKKASELSDEEYKTKLRQIDAGRGLN